VAAGNDTNGTIATKPPTLNKAIPFSGSEQFRWISWFLLMEPEEISRNLAVVSSLARVNESSIQ
jgi:hypothetical protein